MTHFRLFLALALILPAALAFGQDTLYVEHFTNGVPALSWFDPWTPDSLSLTTQFVSGNPSGDGWVGAVSNAYSGGGVGTVLSGALSMADYEIQAQVYCVVSASAGPYNGIVARWDTTGGNSYLSLRSDFDNNQRLQLRWYPGASGFGDSIASWAGAQIPGGVPTQSSWHRLGLKMQGDQIWAYYDNVLLSGSPFTNTDLTQGWFGAYIFKMPGDVQTLFDDVVVLSNATALGSITLTPYGVPIVIPAGGGAFNYNIEAANLTGSPLSCDVWCNVTLPNGSIYGPVLGPVNITLPAGATMDRDRTQNVPAGAPAGAYSHNAYIGDYPASVWDSDSFPFTKLGAGDGGMGAGDWSNVGESFEAGGQNQTPAVHHSSLIAHHLSPNPFNASTVIHFDLPEAGFVDMAVFDVSGRPVGERRSAFLPAGSNQIHFDGSNLPTGIYLYQLRIGEYSAGGKMLLLK